MEAKPMVTADQRNLNAKASFPDITAKVENDRQEIIRKLAKTNEVSKMVHLLLTRI
jgi:hypothetical protein